MKLLFIPFSIATGFAAGAAGRRVFRAVWGAIDEEEAPKPEHRDVPLAKLVAALALEGALFRVTRGLAEHHSRRGFAAVTGSWPGEERPDPE